MSTLSNVKTRRGEAKPLSVRLAPDAYPEAKSSKTGESVKYVPDSNKSWYVFRASHGREDKASDYLVEDGTYTYIAKKWVERYERGKRKKYLQTLIPNLVFAYTTEEKAEEYVNHTPALTFLSYYYNHFELDDNFKNPPLTISSKEMDKYVKATCNNNKHLMFVEPSKVHYKTGELVKVIDGPFMGVEGRVARISGQQRVVITLSKIGLISTAYIPTAFIQQLV
jgi:transcription antitermination factor NusG